MTGRSLRKKVCSRVMVHLLLYMLDEPAARFNKQFNVRHVYTNVKRLRSILGSIYVTLTCIIITTLHCLAGSKTADYQSF